MVTTEHYLEAGGHSHGARDMVSLCFLYLSKGPRPPLWGPSMSQHL